MGSNQCLSFENSLQIERRYLNLSNLQKVPQSRSYGTKEKKNVKCANSQGRKSTKKMKMWLSCKSQISQSVCGLPHHGLAASTTYNSDTDPDPSTEDEGGGPLLDQRLFLPRPKNGRKLSMKWDCLPHPIPIHLIEHHLLIPPFLIPLSIRHRSYQKRTQTTIHLVASNSVNL